MEEKKQGEGFAPNAGYSRKPRELTVTSVAAGALLAVVFGAANAYIGLRAGLTVTASIPAAVIAMGLMRAIRRKDGILESNMIQTIGSAGESLAAGAIFTMPAFFLWADAFKVPGFSALQMTLIALSGGILGVLFMIPLRRTLIVNEHKTLPYPEGTACAKVLLAGEGEGGGVRKVFLGMGAAALIKFLSDGVKLIPGEITIKIAQIRSEFSASIEPALISVGYICGYRIASYMFAGGILGWFALIPAVALLGADAVIFPGKVTVTELYNAGGAGAIWSNYIRYIGAGAVAAGGFISLAKNLPVIAGAFVKSARGLKDAEGGNGGEKKKRTETDIGRPVILGGILASVILIAASPAIPVSIMGAALIVILGFFFTAVSSRMVGLVGSSNNPVSGMAIATLLISTLILKASGHTGLGAMFGAISIGSIICVITAIAGDTSQDLKTGFLLGATPKAQQTGEIIGVAVSAAVIGGVLFLLDTAWGFGSEQIPAPQATLMKMIVEGVMDGSLPWTLVIIGVSIAVMAEVLGIPALPFAIGLYLPLSTSAGIMLGGLLRLGQDRRKWAGGAAGGEAAREAGISSGILCCSGMIAGEGLTGILLAALAVFRPEGFPGAPFNLGNAGGVLAGAAVFLFISFQCGRGGSGGSVGK